MKKIEDIEAFMADPEVVSFIGKDYGKYRERWLRAYHRTKDIDKIQYSPSLNFLCIFPPAWFGYRKQFISLLVFTAFIAFLTVFEIFSGILIHPLVYLGIFLLTSLFACGGYFNYVRKFFENLETEDPEKRQDLISAKGGTSVIMALTGAVAFTVFLVLIYEAAILVAEHLNFDTSHIKR
jgi:hypothetical protein